jgi:hypothetical protein
MRALLAYVVPLFLPLALYIVYVVAARRIMNGQGELSQQLRRLPWLWLLAAGVGLMAISALGFGLSNRSPPDRPYVPPHVEDGRVVPGRVE